MTFKRMMALGAVAAALAFTGCRDRSQSEQDFGTRGTGDQTEQPATGGSGSADSIPGGSNTIGGTPQDTRPGTELGGTGAAPRNDVGGTTNDAVIPPSEPVTPPSDVDDDGTGGSDEGAR